MPRRKVEYAPGSYYHLLNRGALKALLFHEPRAYHLFVQLVKRYAGQFGVTVIVMCLMPNHFHMIVRLEEGGDIVEFMKRLCFTFSLRINKMYNRVGTSFGGRYKAKLIENDAHLRYVCAYVHANPLSAGLVKDPEEWEYSNYREWAKQRDYLPWDGAFVKSMYRRLHKHEELVRMIAEKKLLDHFKIDGFEPGLE
jgi:putative transposase